jgi:hypothetical protein
MRRDISFPEQQVKRAFFVNEFAIARVSRAPVAEFVRNCCVSAVRMRNTLAISVTAHPA